MTLSAILALGDGRRVSNGMNVFRYIKSAKNLILQALFPPVCFGCRTEEPVTGGFLCGKCSGNIKINPAFFCAICKNRLPTPRKVCHKSSPLIAGAPEIYGREPVTELIKLLKYKKLAPLAEPLGDLMSEFLHASGLAYSDYLLVPIPLSAKRLRERGFNQAELLALRLKTNLNISEERYLPRVLRRVTHTKPQAKLASRKEREANVRNCFAIRSPEQIAGQNIILIDDVFTTGSTAKEAALVLKRAGARKIIALAVARA